MNGVGRNSPLKPPPWLGAGETPVPRRSTGRLVAAVLVPSALLAAVATVSVLLLTGVLRFGSPGVLSLSMSTRVDATLKPVKTATSFSSAEPALYCCARVRAFGDTRLEAQWLRGSVLVGDYKSTYAKVAPQPAVRFTTVTGRVAFKLARPGSTWPTGSYSVRVLIDGEPAGETRFAVTKAAPEAEEGSRYEDPSGRFSIMVPAGWSEAEPSSLGGALAGFVAPMGPYPPRYAVSLTDFTSVDIAYLNSILRAEGAADDQLFSQYSIGDLVGARRTFEWDLKLGEEQYRLRTIQVVVQKGPQVYSIDCQSLALDYKADEPTFNAVINSFQ